MAEREAELRDENSWFSFETKIKLWDAAAAVTGDANIAQHIGESALEFGIALGLKRALRALGTPDLVYRNVARANSKFNCTHQFEAVVSEPGHIRLAFHDVSGMGYHPYDCEYTIGLLKTVPQLFGFPPARVSHQFCGCRDADHCEYDVQWVAGISTGARPIVIAGAAGVLFAATGAIFDPLLLGAGAGLAGAAAGLAGIRAAIFTRRRISALETRLRDQDLLTDAQLASLAALSSELRLDDVLDAITASASTAVGGAQFALLIEEGDRMRADRHSGLSTDSLWRLERWAQESNRELSEGPLVLDDLSTVPSLAALAIDRPLPLGSVCAAPLIFSDRLLGALVALAPGTEMFLPQDVRALEIYAGHAAIALSNARLVDQLEREAAEDPLTGLANKRSFELAYTAELNRAFRDGGSIAVITLDVDRFKEINDRYRHSFGDQVLVAVAGAVRSAVRSYDTVARVGGDEFVVLLPDATVEQASVVAERARARVAEIDLPEGRLSCSAGIAAIKGDELSASQMLDAADAALYTAKRLGRDRIELAVVGDQRAA
jgi:diguanylate cyclase (GGDEF)-like protein